MAFQGVSVWMLPWRAWEPGRSSHNCTFSPHHLAIVDTPMSTVGVWFLDVLQCLLSVDLFLSHS